jgi:hypothetical protein
MRLISRAARQLYHGSLALIVIEDEILVGQ